MVLAETPLWQVGETLRYKVYGKGILLGEQVFTIAEETWYKGSPVYHIVMEMKSYSAFAIFFSYHEKDQLFLDKESLYPRYLKREIREGKNERVEETEFLLEEGAIIRQQIISGGVEERVFNSPEPSLENLSLIYYLRARPWRVERDSFQYLSPQGPLTVKYIYSGVETVDTPLGKFKADKIEDPVSAITIWFAREGKAVPLLIRVASDFGQVDSKLMAIES